MVAVTRPPGAYLCVACALPAAPNRCPLLRWKKFVHLSDAAVDLSPAFYNRSDAYVDVVAYEVVVLDAAVPGCACDACLRHRLRLACAKARNERLKPYLPNRVEAAAGVASRGWLQVPNLLTLLPERANR